MRILIFGGTGMLGHKLVQSLRVEHDIWTTIRGTFAGVRHFGIFDPERTIDAVDVTEMLSIENAIKRSEPEVVINAIGVVKQSPASTDVEETLMLNSILPHRLSRFGQRFGYRLITISTDCVFDGRRGNYSERDVPNAVDLYGRSKQIGEVTAENCLTIRTSIIGRELRSRLSLLEWVLSNRGGRIAGYKNAIYSGFPTIVFADIISSLLDEHPSLSGIYHIASEPISKFDLIELINTYYDAEIEIMPDTDFMLDRSLDGGLFHEATGFQSRPWSEMVERMASDPTPYDNWI